MTQTPNTTHLSLGIYFFSHDLRVHDNPLLHRAAQEVDQLLCVFCYPSWWSEINQQQLTSLGQHRARFLSETLRDLNTSLSALGQTLVITDSKPDVVLSQVSSASKVTHLYRSHHVGVYEQTEWRPLRTVEANVVELPTHTLFEQGQLPFDLVNLPESFTQFRKAIESQIEPTLPTPELTQLPPAPMSVCKNQRPISKVQQSSSNHRQFVGGEPSALAHLDNYFSSTRPLKYKEVRNALYGWNNSTKFSAWLANGSLSVRTLFHRLRQFEHEVDKNSSTYWIYFELLWREYFQWYAQRHRAKLFAFSGIKGRKPLTSFYPERFKKWCVGNTPYPIVNACMRELNATGFLSNRGRQIAASCLVNELQLDWRYGAAYFEQQLIDYDVAANWGNWQYLAGVGADTRDKRHFNLEKQTQLYDHDGRYRAQWQATQNTVPLDSVDAADWPLI